MYFWKSFPCYVLLCLCYVLLRFCYVLLCFVMFCHQKPYRVGTNVQRSTGRPSYRLVHCPRQANLFFCCHVLLCFAIFLQCFAMFLLFFAMFCYVLLCFCYVLPKAGEPALVTRGSDDKLAIAKLILHWAVY